MEEIYYTRLNEQKHMQTTHVGIDETFHDNCSGYVVIVKKFVPSLSLEEVQKNANLLISYTMQIIEGMLYFKTKNLSVRDIHGLIKSLLLFSPEYFVRRYCKVL